MNYSDITDLQKERILPLLRQVIILQARRWDAEDEIEAILHETEPDVELNVPSDFITDLAANVDQPADGDDALFITPEVVDEYLQLGLGEPEPSVLP